MRGISAWICLLLLLLPGVALADGGVRLAAGQVARDVVATGQSVEIGGQVHGEVVVLFGDLHLTSTAVVHDNVLVLGGHLQRDPGAQVGKGIYVLQAWPGMAASVGWALALYGAATFLKLAWIALLVGSTLLWPRRLADPTSSHRRRLLVGLLWGAALLLLLAGLTLTRWGIPVAGALALLGLLTSTAGLSRVALEIGRRLAGLSGGRSLAAWQQGLVGATVIVLSTGLPVAGPLLLAGWSLLGLGTCALGTCALGLRRRAT